MEWFLLYLLIVNLLSFLLTAADKRRAKKNKRRLPEAAMVRFALLFGGVGVLAAFYLFRHKTKHIRLLVTIWGITVLEAALLVFLWFFFA